MDRFCGTSLRTFGWLICLAGCANYSLRSPLARQDSIAPSGEPTASSTATSAATSQPQKASAGTDVAATPAPLMPGSRTPAGSADSQDLPTVLAELETLGAIDAPTRDRLVDDLKKTDPALWPQLLAYFKASLAYRQKYGTGGEPAQSVDAPPASDLPTAASGQPSDAPALLPRAPSAKPLTAARATTATDVSTVADAAAGVQSRSGPASPGIADDKTITDHAVQPAAYQTGGPPAEEKTLAATGATPPAAIAKATVETSLGGAAPAIVASVAHDPMPTTAAPVAAQTAATASGSPATPLPTSASPPAAAVAVGGNKPGSPAPAAEIDSLDWHAHLKAAIRGLERETADPPATTSGIGRHAGLRLLYLVDGDRDGALRPLAGISATQQDFWSQQLFGLSTYLDAERTPDDARRAAAAVVHLRDANLKLGDVATLTVRNLAFATEVHSYGVYKKFDHYEFHPGQEVLLYAEVENFKSAATDQGFHTALRSSYQILDNRGARVDQKEFEMTEEHCQNPRRDYFIRYFVWMPKRIYGGTYTLQLTIEDTLSQKIGQASIDFTVADKE